MDKVKNTLSNIALYAIVAIVNPLTAVLALILLAGFVETM